MTERDEILLERYVNQELSPEERTEFEVRLEQDTEFAEAYELHKAMKSFLKENKKSTQFATFLEGVSTSYFEGEQQVILEKEESPIVPIWKRRTFIGGVLAVAAVIAGTLFFPFLTSPDLYEQFNDHRPLALAEQSSDANKELTTAEEAFNTGNFQTANTALDKYLHTKPNDVEAQLYKGIALLELNQSVEASSIFQTIATSNSLLQPEALWYWALAYLKQGDTTNAKTKLELLITENKDSELRKRAELLLLKLE